MNPALLTLRTFLWNTTCRRPLSLIIFLIGGLLMWLIFSRVRMSLVPPPSNEDIDWEAEYEKMRIANLKENMGFYVRDPKNLKPVPLQWTAKDHCPACFGIDMCEAIENGDVRIDIPTTDTPASKKGVYFGQWRDIPIAIKRLSNLYPQEFESFDKYICKDAAGSEKCNVSIAITNDKSVVQQKTTFEPENMHQLWKISYRSDGPLSLAYTLCVTPQVVKMFSGMYDGDGDGLLSRADKAMLFTSMVVQPESLMLKIFASLELSACEKFLKGIQFQRLAPRAYGACGRLIVVEHGGRMLAEHLNNSFSERAELAMQLMSLVQVLWVIRDVAALKIRHCWKGGVLRTPPSIKLCIRLWVLLQYECCLSC